MSASLVGSEMCIRDRSTPSPASRTPKRRSGMTWGRGCCNHGSGARWGAVSYTHLTLPTICSV
eukprot:5364502-Alexandrium_andersonii.AAC.1